MWMLPDHQVIDEIAKRVADSALDWKRVDGVYFRAVFQQHLVRRKGLAAGHWTPKPLYALSSLGGARYTPRTPANDPNAAPGLYLSFDPTTPPTELRLVIYGPHGSVSKTAKPPFVTLSVHTHVDRVIDLTDVNVSRHFDLQNGDLHADWEGEERAYLAGPGRMPATQLLAYALHATGMVAGIMYPAARTRTPESNLVVFPMRLSATSVPPDSVVVEDPGNLYGTAGRLP